MMRSLLTGGNMFFKWKLLGGRDIHRHTHNQTITHTRDPVAHAPTIIGRQSHSDRTNTQKHYLSLSLSLTYRCRVE